MTECDICKFLDAHPGLDIMNIMKKADHGPHRGASFEFLAIFGFRVPDVNDHFDLYTSQRIKFTDKHD